jgi:hypothetical protein
VVLHGTAAAVVLHGTAAAGAAADCAVDNPEEAHIQVHKQLLGLVDPSQVAEDVGKQHAARVDGPRQEDIPAGWRALDPKNQGSLEDNSSC